MVLLNLSLKSGKNRCDLCFIIISENIEKIIIHPWNDFR